MKMMTALSLAAVVAGALLLGISTADPDCYNQPYGDAAQELCMGCVAETTSGKRADPCRPFVSPHACTGRTDCANMTKEGRCCARTPTVDDTEDFYCCWENTLWTTGESDTFAAVWVGGLLVICCGCIGVFACCTRRAVSSTPQEAQD